MNKNKNPELQEVESILTKIESMLPETENILSTQELETIGNYIKEKTGNLELPNPNTPKYPEIPIVNFQYSNEIIENWLGGKEPAKNLRKDYITLTIDIGNDKSIDIGKILRSRFSGESSDHRLKYRKSSDYRLEYNEENRTLTLLSDNESESNSKIRYTYSDVSLPSRGEIGYSFIDSPSRIEKISRSGEILETFIISSKSGGKTPRISEWKINGENFTFREDGSIKYSKDESNETFTISKDGKTISRSFQRMDGDIEKDVTEIYKNGNLSSIVEDYQTDIYDYERLFRKVTKYRNDGSVLSINKYMEIHDMTDISINNSRLANIERIDHLIDDYGNSKYEFLQNYPSGRPNIFREHDNKGMCLREVEYRNTPESLIKHQRDYSYHSNGKLKSIFISSCIRNERECLYDKSYKLDPLAKGRENKIIGTQLTTFHENGKVEFTRKIPDVDKELFEETTYSTEGHITSKRSSTGKGGTVFFEYYNSGEVKSCQKYQDGKITSSTEYDTEGNPLKQIDYSKKIPNDGASPEDLGENFERENQKKLIDNIEEGTSQFLEDILNKYKGQPSQKPTSQINKNTL